MTSNHDKPSGGSVLVLGGAALLMVACCALLPLVLVGGTLAGFGGFLGNPWVIGTGIVLLVLAVVSASSRRRRGATHGDGCCPPAGSVPTDTHADVGDEPDQ